MLSGMLKNIFFYFHKQLENKSQLKIPENWKIWKKPNKMSGCYLYTDCLLIGLTDLKNINSGGIFLT